MRRFGPLLDRGRERDVGPHALARVELDRDPDTLVADLSPAEKALVAVARLLDRGARVLFIDEATSTLPPAESRRLIDALAQTVSEGATVIMVSHKLSEILDVTQRVVVILDGNLAADSLSSELDREALVKMLVVHESQTLERRTASIARRARRCCASRVPAGGAPDRSTSCCAPARWSASPGCPARASTTSPTSLTAS